MKTKLFQAFTISVIIDLAFLVQGLGIPLNWPEVENFLRAFFYLFIFFTIQIVIGIIVWFYLSERLSKAMQVKNDKKYLFFLLLNIFIPPAIILIDALISWGARINSHILFVNYFSDYIYKYAFIILGVLPTLIKYVLDKFSEITTPNKSYSA